MWINLESIHVNIRVKLRKQRKRSHFLGSIITFWTQMLSLFSILPHCLISIFLNFIFALSTFFSRKILLETLFSLENVNKVLNSVCLTHDFVLLRTVLSSQLFLFDQRTDNSTLPFGINKGSQSCFYVRPLLWSDQMIMWEKKQEIKIRESF